MRFSICCRGLLAKAVLWTLLGAAMAAAPLRLWAAQTLADADWFERRLADGVVWKFYLFDDLFGSKQSVSYIDADLNNPNVAVELPYLASSRQKTSTMVPGQFAGAAAGLNGTYFDTTGTGGAPHLPARQRHRDSAGRRALLGLRLQRGARAGCDRCGLDPQDADGWLGQ